MKIVLEEDYLRKIIKESILNEVGFKGKVNISGTTSSSSNSLPPGEYGDPSEMSISEEGVNFIKDEEGFRKQVYDDKTSRIINSYDNAEGNPTIGIGHLIFRVGVTDEKQKYEKYLGGGQEMSNAEVIALFKEDLQDHVKLFKEQITAKITQDMFDALASYAFNVGANGPKRDGIVDLINQEKYNEAAQKIRNGPTNNGVEGIIRRRAKEADMFLSKHR